MLMIHDLAKALVVVDVDDGRVLVERAGSPEPITAAGLDAASGLVVAGFGDGHSEPWQAGGQAALATLGGHRERVWDVQFASGGQLVVTAAVDGSVQTWDRSRWQATWRFAAMPPLFRVQPSEDGRMVAVSSRSSISLWDVDAHRKIVHLDEDEGRLRGVGIFNSILAFSPDRSMLAYTAGSGHVVLKDISPDTRSPEEVARLSADRSPWHLRGGMLEPRDPAVR
jgi:WD40 repeat protein